MSEEINHVIQEKEKQLYQFFLNKTGDPNDAHDLLQDLYESVLNNLDSFALLENQGAWLFRSAQNKIIDWYRKRSRQDSISLDEETLENQSLLDLLIDPFYDLEDLYFRNSLLDALEMAIAALPEQYKSIIVAQALEQRTFKSLSEEWDIPVGTLLSRKREGIRLLGLALDDFASVWEDWET